MWNAWLDESHAGIKITGRNINNFRYAGDTTLMAESEEELKSLLMGMKEDSEKSGLKLNIPKTERKVETVTDFIFLSSRITVDGECSRETKRSSLLGRKTMTNLDSILKSRHITLLTKVRIVKAMFFPVVMYGCESWTLKKTEQRRIDAFKLWCWRRLLRVTWTARRSNQLIWRKNQLWIFIGRTDAEAPILWTPDVKSWFIEKDPDAGKDWRQEEKGMTEVELVGWHHWLDGHESEQTPGDSEGRESLVCCSPWSCKEWDMT